MKSSSSSVPPGFRFHPTDEELVGYYLKKKIASQKIDLDVIRDIDLYRIEPWDLQERCRIGYEEQKEWYFFSHKDKKYPTGTRTNRATMVGFWKATGRDKAVYSKNFRLIGMRKTLVFYKGRAPNGMKTDWIIHEYRLESDENGVPQEEGWVVCRAFKKRSNGQTKHDNEMGWESSSYYYDQSSHGIVGSVGNSVDYISRQRKNYICKQEINDQVDSFGTCLHSQDSIVELNIPPLESPSLPLIKMPSSNTILMSPQPPQPPPTLPEISTVKENEEGVRGSNNNGTEKVTDWRDLDRFVASQLSHEEGRLIPYDDDEGICSKFGADLNNDIYNSDIALQLLQQQQQSSSSSSTTTSKEEDDQIKWLNGLLMNSVSSDTDNIGICI